MKECVRIIDSMDISDNEKRNIHNMIDQYQRDYLNNIGKLLVKSFDIEVNYRVEHTHMGLNLRVSIPKKNEVKAKQIRAICRYANLNREQTRYLENNIWLRFAF